MNNTNQRNAVKTNKEKVENRINEVKELLDELQTKKQELDNGKPPAKEHPMNIHVEHAAEQAGIDRENLVMRTRRSGEKEASGFNKQAFIELNQYIHELQQKVEELEDGGKAT